MTIEDLKNHCEKQIDLCSKLNDYKHLEEHQLILNLIKENQELKKQLKDKTEDYKRMKDNFDSKVDVLTKIETQQKEFIKYLEDEINKWNYNYDSYNYEYEVEEPTAEELANKILQKYKEIIGVSDENSKN